MQCVYEFFGVWPGMFWVGVFISTVMMLPFIIASFMPMEYEDDNGNTKQVFVIEYILHKLFGFILSKRVLIACSALFIAYQVNATLSAYRAACNAKVAAFEKIDK